MEGVYLMLTSLCHYYMLSLYSVHEVEESFRVAQNLWEGDEVTE